LLPLPQAAAWGNCQDYRITSYVLKSKEFTEKMLLNPGAKRLVWVLIALKYALLFEMLRMRPKAVRLD